MPLWYFSMHPKKFLAGLGACMHACECMHQGRQRLYPPTVCFIKAALSLSGARTAVTFALDLLVCVSEWRLTPGLGRNTQVGWARSFQRGLKKATGFTLPFVYGRGLFGVPVGMLPHRVPLTSVVGAPISVPKFTGDLARLQHSVICLRQDAMLIQRNLIAVSRRE